ncbi:MAG: methylated-DNA--[protein]-cysteine S-methyltransferase [Nanopusillaceae archaeon]
MINVIDKELFSGYIVKETKILAYSLGYDQESLIKHIEKIAKFHNLDGDLVFDENMDKFFQEAIYRALRGEKYKFELNLYKYNKVYEELLKVERGKTITYKELKDRTGLNYREIILALKYNPFIILIPCHRVIKSNGDLGNYTPLGREFKEKLLKFERAI